jgi:hypothetical protein
LHRDLSPAEVLTLFKPEMLMFLRKPEMITRIFHTDKVVSGLILRLSKVIDEANLPPSELANLSRIFDDLAACSLAEAADSTKKQIPALAAAVR